jgi:hypothetical protein
MNFTTFAMLFMIGSLMASLLTEAFKKAFDEAGVKYSNNMLALCMAFIIGMACMSGAYIILKIPFDAIGLICIAFMSLAIWVGSMVGYDKVKQLIDQLSKLG